MSDPNEPQDPKPQGDPEELGDGGKKALNAERNRANTAERRVTELENQISQLQTEHQTALDAATQIANDATAAQSAAEANALKYRVALEAGLPAKHVGRLTGETEDEMKADAAELVADLVPGSTTPRPDPSQGPKGDEPKLSNADQFAEQLANF